MSNMTDNLIAYMATVGIVPIEELQLGGDITRFHVEGDSPGKQNGWCALNMGEFIFASFGSWQLKAPTTPAEMKLAKKSQAEVRDKYKSDRDRKHKQGSRDG